MAVLAGKSQTEKRKIIAAGVLGVLMLFVLYFAFGRGIFGGSTSTATIRITPTPKPTVSPGASNDKFRLPTAEEQRLDNEVTLVVYNPQSASAPDPGRNIFSFYEPPEPCKKNCPTPIPKPTATPTPGPTPTPVPPPPLLVQSANPSSAYAGSKGFHLEVGGDFFTADSHIYFNQTELPTTFGGPQRLSAEVPASLIAQEGPKQIIVQTPDGKTYSNSFNFTAQAAPKPSLQYIGMIARKRGNNDTAYFINGVQPNNLPSAPPPFGARLNDVVGGRFRLIDISSAEVVLEDTQLGFKYKIAITKAPTGGNGQPSRPDGFMPYNPNGVPQGEIPGIPGNIQRYVPPQQPPQPPPQKQQKQDVDDDGDGK